MANFSCTGANRITVRSRLLIYNNVYTWRRPVKPKHVVKWCLIEEQRTTLYLDGAEPPKSEHVHSRHVTYIPPSYYAENNFRIHNWTRSWDGRSREILQVRRIHWPPSPPNIRNHGLELCHFYSLPRMILPEASSSWTLFSSCNEIKDWTMCSAVASSTWIYTSQSLAS
jgi:hypothetical protein